MRQKFVSAIAVLLTTLFVPLVMSDGARAQGQPVLLELFTSQGCSSCPPADALLGELAQQDNVIALAYHVDYWDYLGWKDTFGKQAHTLRQRTYAGQVDRQYIGQSFGGIFTPEVVIQGHDSLIGSSRATILDRIAAHSRQAPAASLDVTRAEGKLIIRVAATSGEAPKARLMVATYLPEARVDVKRGENAGRTLVYHHVVTGLTHAADWNGQDAINVTVSGIEGAAVVFLQRGGGGPVLAVAQSDG